LRWQEKNPASQCDRESDMRKKIIISFLLFLPFIEILFAAGEKVFINQVGYPSYSKKYVFISKPVDSFRVINISDGKIYFSGKPDLSVSGDASTGLNIYKGDFSALNKNGVYIIITSNNDSSYQFSISDSIYNDVYRKVLKGFYFQRCGIDLTSVYAGQYTHSKCHQLDGVLHSSTSLSGYISSAGGWHDAGDYGKYVINAGVTVGTLLMGYELFPSRFAFDDLNIPESNNKIPDILDEIRYELNWLLTMQDSNSGGVYAKLTRETFEDFSMPQNDQAIRWIYQISSAATADFAAMMAKAGRIYQKFDQFFAATCLNAAKKAWNYLTLHTSIVPAGGFKNPSGTSTGEYGDMDDRDERIWAAAELFITTAEDVYHNYFLAHYQDKSLFNSAMGWQDVGSLALLAYLTNDNSKKNTAANNKILSSLGSFCQKIYIRKLTDGFDLVISKDEYYWGSNSVLLNDAILLYIYGNYVNTTLYMDIALEQLNYIFGVNYYGKSYVTGVGSNPVMNPHHRPSASDGIKAPVPGLLAGGPDKNLEDNILKANFNQNTPPAVCYSDNKDSYASNEIAINWNAPLVFLTGAFCTNNNSTGIKSIEKKTNEKKTLNSIEINQNYPNPFNHMTQIGYTLGKPQNIILKIFDILGREIYNQNLGFIENGYHTIAWSAQKPNGSPVSSGIYYIMLEGESRSEMKKIILLY
jgi:endoglucanase